MQQLEDNVGALANLDFTDEELSEIDRYATDSGINLWSAEGIAPRAGAVWDLSLGYAIRDREHLPADRLQTDLRAEQRR